MIQEEKNSRDPVAPNKEQQQATTQCVVPDLIDKLHKATVEVLQNSNGPPLVYHLDPHLRLRRTLTPRSKITGIPKYSEAQFVIHPTTGKRRTLHFETALNGGDEREFLMDAYFWGATEEEATVRMVTCHGISPTASRERWHALGWRIQHDPVLSKKIRFVDMDWHSIDRGDAYQEDFLTMLPKHIFDCPSEETVQEIAAMLQSRRIEKTLPRSSPTAKSIVRELWKMVHKFSKQSSPKDWDGGYLANHLFRASSHGREASASSFWPRQLQLFKVVTKMRLHFASRLLALSLCTQLPFSCL